MLDAGARISVSHFNCDFYLCPFLLLFHSVDSAVTRSGPVCACACACAGPFFSFSSLFKMTFLFVVVAVVAAAVLCLLLPEKSGRSLPHPSHSTGALGQADASIASEDDSCTSFATPGIAFPWAGLAWLVPPSFACVFACALFPSSLWLWIWSMEYGVWSVECGVWSMESGEWRMHCRV